MVFLAQTQRRMNETYSGGIGSFVLTMMIVSFLQMKQRQCAVPTRMQNGGADGNGNGPADGDPQALPTPSWNLGTLLLDFFHLYGVSFNYYSAGISITEGGSYLVKRKRSKPEGNNGRYAVALFTTIIARFCVCICACFL